MGKNKLKDSMDKLQLKMLRAQQGVWHQKERVIIVFEGTDAAGKGGAIRRVTEKLDPRGFHVHPIGEPKPENQEKHFLYRFWTKLPEKGSIAIFDRSWYGRVLVEKVDKLAPPGRLKDAYKEINQFEKMLVDDGIILIKICLLISKKEQLKRFQARLDDPYKQWKITEADLKARGQWSEYHKAFKQIFLRSNTSYAPWIVIETDDKDEARAAVLDAITHRLKKSEIWIEDQARLMKKRKLKTELEKLEKNLNKKQGR
jgi:AMP-polyphosphate phosphotransferase